MPCWSRVGVATEPARRRHPRGRGRRPAARSRWTPPRRTSLVAIVPSWRRDLEIEADVAEEVARVRGYELIPDILPHTPMPPYRPSPLRLRDTVREVLAGRGPVGGGVVRARVTGAWSSASRPSRTRSSPGRAPPAVGRSRSRTRCRASTRSCASGCWAACSRWPPRTSARVAPDVAIFEIGKGYGAQRRRRRAPTSGGGSASS